MSVMRDINITLLKTDQEKIDTIKNKIKNTSITLPAATNPDINNVATTKLFKKSLQTANPTLSDNDLTYMTFTAPKLSPWQMNTVEITIKVKEASVSQDIKVTLLKTDQEKVKTIFDKFAVRTITLPQVPVVISIVVLQLNYVKNSYKKQTLH